MFIHAIYMDFNGGNKFRMNNIKLSNIDEIYCIIKFRPIVSFGHQKKKSF
jgi:hypothetical protein